jgi:uncharacterized protein (DUF2235 family)
MAKRIVVCLDGTWHEEEKIATNVKKLHDGLEQSTMQAVEYFSGVGTQLGQKVRGGHSATDSLNKSNMAISLLSSVTNLVMTFTCLASAVVRSAPGASSGCRCTVASYGEIR